MIDPVPERVFEETFNAYVSDIAALIDKLPEHVWSDLTPNLQECWRRVCFRIAYRMGELHRSDN